MSVYPPEVHTLPPTSTAYPPTPSRPDSPITAQTINPERRVEHVRESHGTQVDGGSDERRRSSKGKGVRRNALENGNATLGIERPEVELLCPGKRRREKRCRVSIQAIESKNELEKGRSTDLRFKLFEVTTTRRRGHDFGHSHEFRSLKRGLGLWSVLDPGYDDTLWAGRVPGRVGGLVWGGGPGRRFPALAL